MNKTRCKSSVKINTELKRERGRENACIHPSHHTHMQIYRKNSNIYRLLRKTNFFVRKHIAGLKGVLAICQNPPLSYIFYTEFVLKIFAKNICVGYWRSKEFVRSKFAKIDNAYPFDYWHYNWFLEEIMNMTGSV